ncbi:TRAP transporter small permease subunit [Mesobacterium sp. TK19101]|uniref:TRAP transporter small permease protein n=1 Tax=Mesobacterium hydrothermale TaxID=3111907 RepID=A0ABU6HD35_9RHOB|nr:TRAP transporter small permease subunit [Mesobacterium sp. TK19101]
MDTSDVVVAITDPGEVDRETHNKFDRGIVAIGNVFAWLFPILMVAICAQVILRQAGHNQAWLDDLQWWLYGAAVLIGIAYAVTTNSHVRVDIRYDSFTKAKKLRTEILALAWCFLPFIILAWDVTLNYAISSVVANEGSDSPNGLHNLWILKVFMNVSFLVIAVAIWGAYSRYLAMLTNPVLWKKLLFAFPSVMFALNLAIYYATFWIVYLTSPEGTSMRQVGRHWLFDEFELGPWDIKYTVAAALIATVVVIAVARLMDRGAKAGQEG